MSFEGGEVVCGGDVSNAVDYLSFREGGEQFSAARFVGENVGIWGRGVDLAMVLESVPWVSRA